MFSSRSGGQKSAVEVQAGPCPLWNLEWRILPCLFLGGWLQSLVFLGLWIHHSSLRLHCHRVCSPVCQSKSPLSIERPVILDERPTFLQYDFTFTNWLHLQWPYFRIRSHSQALGDSIPTYGFGEHNLTADNLQTALCDLDIDENEECSLCPFVPAPLSLSADVASPSQESHRGWGQSLPLLPRWLQEEGAVREKACLWKPSSVSSFLSLSLPASSLLPLPRLLHGHLWESTWQACMTVKVWSLSWTFNFANDSFTKTSAVFWLTPFLVVSLETKIETCTADQN